MRRVLLLTATVALSISMAACNARRTEDAVNQGAGRALSPAESGMHGPEAYNRPPFGVDKSKMDAEHQTAGLTPELSNDKTDETMEGSGNLAWQGSYEREKRAKTQQQQTTP